MASLQARRGKELGTQQHIDTKHEARLAGRDLHPAWVALIEYCRKLDHGDIERLRIQNGVPVLAELITQKVKFSS